MRQYRDSGCCLDQGGRPGAADLEQVCYNEGKVRSKSQDQDRDQAGPGHTARPHPTCTTLKLALEKLLQNFCIENSCLHFARATGVQEMPGYVYCCISVHFTWKTYLKENRQNKYDQSLYPVDKPGEER